MTIQNSVTKFVSHFKEKKEYSKINYLFKRGNRRMIIYTAIISLIYIALCPLIANFLKISISNVLLITPFIMLSLILPLNRGILQGFEKFNVLGWNMILEGSIKFFVMLLLVYAGFKAGGALAAVNISLFIALIFLFPYLDIKKKYQKFNTKKVYVFSFITLVALVLVTMIYSLDVFLVKHFFDAISAGHYAALSLLGKIVFFGGTAIGLVMFPKISGEKSRKKSKKILKKSIIFSVIIMAAIVLLYAFFSKTIVDLIFGSSYLEIYPLLFKFGIAMMFLSFSYLIVLQKLAEGKTKFIYLLMSAVLLEITAIALFHQSLDQVVNIMMILNIPLTLGLSLTK